MIIKSKKTNIFIYCILMLLTSFYFSYDKNVFIVVAHDTYSRFMSSNPGFSTARNIIDTGGNNKHQSIIEKALLITGKIDEVFLNKLNNSQDKGLDKIGITIKFSNFRKILGDRSRAISQGFLDKPTVVNGVIHYKGNPYKAKIRLKGDLGDHWLSKHRMSFRVSLKNGETIFGFNKFSIQKPRARQYPYEQAFQETLRQSGNITAIYKFADVNVNGEDYGIMVLEENVSKEFLEKQRRKDSLVFRFSNDKKWLNYGKGVEDNYEYYRYSDSKLIATLFKQRKYLRNRLNRKRYTYVLEERLKEEHSSLYSIEPHMRAFFTTLLWNNLHTLSDSNSRYYFNPYTLQLEPITTDQGMFSLYTQKLNTHLKDMFLTETYQQVLMSLRNDNDKNKYLTKAKESLVHIEDKLNQFKSYFPLDAYKEDEVLLTNINFITKNKAELNEWLNNYDLTNHSNNIITNIPSAAQGKHFPEHLHVRHYDDGKLLFYNLLPDEVKIKRIIFDGNVTDYADFIIPGYTGNNYEPYILQTSITGIQDDKIMIHSSYAGHKRSIGVYPTFISDDISNPLTRGTTKNIPFLSSKGDGLWEIIPGEWIVKQPIVVDGNLRMKAGTHLKLSKDSYLIVKGTIDFVGSKKAPIIFESLDSGWKGLYVLSDEGRESILHNVIFRDTTGLVDGLLALSGGVNIYKGSVDIRGVTIDGASAEDALNIVKASILVDGLNIKNTTSDAFDCDYCVGVINKSHINNVGGDALDFSGSDLEIKSVELNHVKDKGLSVGEASIVDVKNSTLSNVGVGIASKDGSKVTGNNVVIRDYKMYAAMTYSKKKHYDIFSSLKLINCRVDGSSPYLRQMQTSLKVNGIEVLERVVNVKSLYSSAVMKK